MAVKTFDLSVILKMVDRFSNPMKQSMLNFNNAISRIEKSNSTLKKFGQNMRNVGQKMSMAVTLPMTILAGTAIRTAAQFDSSMNMVGAVTRTQIGGTVLPAFVKLRDEAKRLGATTQFTASEVAGGMQFLGMAGLDATNILAAIPNVLELAASAQLDMASAANIVTNIMASQKMGAEELGHANDVLVSAFTRANVNLQMLGESFKYAGAVTRDAGLSIEETAAAFGIMGQQGIQASMAGSGLRTAMAKMMAPSSQLIKLMSNLGIKIFKMKDGQPVLKSLVDIIKEFEKAGADSGKLIEMFGLRAGPSFAALVSEGSDSLQKFVDLMKNDVGIASSIAQAQMTGLPGALKELTSAWEGLQLSVMESSFGDMIIAMIRGLSSFIRKLNETHPKILAAAAIFMTLVAVIAPLVILLGIMAGAFAAIGAVIGVAASAVALMVAAFVAGAALMVAAVYYILKHLDKIKQFFLDLPSIVSKAMKSVWEYKGIFGKNDGTSWKWKGLFGDSNSASASASSINPSIVGPQNGKADVTVRVMAENGSSAQVDDVKQSGMLLKVLNDFHLGVTGGY